MANCPRCNAHLLQGYDHCANCGLPLSAMKPQYDSRNPQSIPADKAKPLPIPKTQTKPPQPNTPSSNMIDPKFFQKLSAKVDTLGFVWLFTGLIQMAYGLTTAISAFMLFLQAHSSLDGLNLDDPSYYMFQQNRTRALISIFAMLALIIIGFLNYLDGKNRRKSAEWLSASNSNTIVDQFYPISTYYPIGLRNLIFSLSLSLGLLSIYPIIMGLIGVIGFIMLIKIRYFVLKELPVFKR